MAAEPDQREERILDSAARLIVRYGFDKTTVSEIAEEAGISKGAIYLHFKSKEDLFVALILRESHHVLEEVIRLMESDPDGGSLFSLYSTTLLVMANSALMRAIITSDKRVLGETTKRLRQSPFMTQWRTFSVEVVEQFQKAGLVRDDITPAQATYIFSIFRYGVLTLEDYVPEFNLPLEEMNAVLPDVVRRALAPEGGGNREAGKQIVAQMAEKTRELIAMQRQEMQASQD